MILKQNDVSTEGLVSRVFQNGQTVNVGDMGNLLQQYALGTALSNSVTETSVFTLTALAPQIVGNSARAGHTTLALPVIPGGFLGLGTALRGQIYGTITNTGTPTVRARVVLKNSAGTVVYTLADTTATATTAITGTRELYIEFDAMTAAVGTSGSILGRIALTYGTTAILNTTIKAAPAAVTVDTTQSYTLDVLFTWGTANASNTIQTAMAYLEVE